ncbi:MAG: methyltransferase domain-containing protein [Rickettsiales bacterium]|nr:methyltransferase domain-containing protein [Rickettsiales bacterium]
MSPEFEINLKNNEEIFKNMFDDGINGHLISHRGRAQMDPKDIKYLIYGEMPFLELAHIFEEPKISDDFKRASVFYDLGSGTGKVVIGAALLLPKLKKIIGIEIVETLFDTSVQIREKFESQTGLTNKIEFINDNFLKIDYSSPSPDIVFMHYPMHEAENLYLELEEKLTNELKPGTLIVSCIRDLKNTETFPLLAKTKINCSYSGVTVYYHRKI